MGDLEAKPRRDSGGAAEMGPPSPTTALASPLSSTAGMSTRSGGSPSRANDLSQGLFGVYQRAERSRQEAAWQRRLKRAEELRAEAMKLLEKGPGILPGTGMSTEELKAMVEEDMKGGQPDAKELDEEMLKKRKALAAEKKKKKEEEKARIKKENEEQKKRLKNTKSKTDDDTSDDATGAARAKAEKERQARMKADKAALKKANAEARERIKNTEAATDNDITDDVRVLEDGTVIKGGGRDAAAAESKARKEEEAAQLAAENAEYREMIANTGAATDNDITDDVTVAADGTVITGGGREAAAEASRERKAEEEAMRLAENAALSDMIENTKAWTDNDVSDDATGQARIAAAKEAEANREEAAAELAAENEEMADRIEDIKEG